ncbi:MAG: RyR domain-containing protein [Bacteroidetes bacterium]|nr:RyR domain-containing protein [Bacteroidota bacterium]
MTKKILILGDVAIDHLYFPVPQQDQGENWKLYPSLQTTLLPGGAFVLSDFVKHAIAACKTDASVIGQKVPEDLQGEVARAVIQTKVLLRKYDETDKKGNKNKIIRVEKYHGYSSPASQTPVFPDLEGDPTNTDLVLLDDAGNGFRDHAEVFPTCFENPQTMLVYKMSHPVATGKLWEKVSARKEDWVLILQAKDIRGCNHVNISKALSWERTAMEMVYQLKRNASLSELQKVPYLVILFGTDGALLYPRNPEEKPLLIFDPGFLEGGFASSVKGMSLSTGSAFAASLSVRLIQQGMGGLVDGIKNGLSSMRNLLKAGFIENNLIVSYPYDKIFGGEPYHYSDCVVEPSFDLNKADPKYWRMLDEKTRLSKPLVTKDIVKNKSPKILKEIPIGIFNKMQTIDRSEIEQFNTIKNLILEFLDDPKTLRPLCIAVFGPPGSGKSFGIKQVLSSLGRNDIPTMTFNISQYASYDDLVADFHKVRDKVLEGAIPVAFFDEFDSDYDHHPMGWLKYFLSPMQDGEFKEGEAIHPVGKSIFVFAGGTRSSFSDFEQNIGSEPAVKSHLSEEEKKREEQKRMEQFREAKGPDFVSRLRGFINILGPNPNNRSGRTDNSFIIRRAKILRVTFEFTDKTTRLFNSHGELQVDESVLRAMLNIPEYKHGNRSMSAILDMSRLTDKEKFDLSALPTSEQLDMHVDAALFMWLAGRERFYTLLPVEERLELPDISPVVWENQVIELIAEKMHEDYCHQRELQGQNTTSCIPWKELANDKQQSNRDAAAEVPVKLGLTGHGIRRIIETEQFYTPDISDGEIETMAREEHNRWCREHRIQGWRYGKILNEAEKLHPGLVLWEELPENEQNKDREAIYAIPRILKDVGLTIYRVEAYDVIDESLIRKMAFAIHEDYCEKRKLEGETVQTNPSLVHFGKLSEDIREANYDNARTIPRKLKLLRIELRKTMAGTEPVLLELTPKEIEDLSKWEHTRWNWQKIMQGWIYGAKKDVTKKIHPNILPWNQLTEADKEKDRESIRLIPGFIKEAGYHAIRR